jgi:hypothetical protein
MNHHPLNGNLFTIHVELHKNLTPGIDFFRRLEAKPGSTETDPSSVNPLLAKHPHQDQLRNGHTLLRPSVL